MCHREERQLPISCDRICWKRIALFVSQTLTLLPIVRDRICWKLNMLPETVNISIGCRSPAIGFMRRRSPIGAIALLICPQISIS
jgi:hypothetical protein